MSRWLAAVALAAVALLSAGCGNSGPSRYRVSGTVTHDGRPVRAGRIVFEPDATRGNSGPQGFAAIADGRYDTSAPHCKGAVGGPTIVTIDSTDFGSGGDVSGSGVAAFPTHRETIDLPQAEATRDFVVPKTSAKR